MENFCVFKMRISKFVKVLWAMTAVVIGVLTYSSLTRLEETSHRFLPPDTDLNIGVDGASVKVRN